MNKLYVQLTGTINSENTIFLEMFMSIFKFVWNVYAVDYGCNKLKKYSSQYGVQSDVVMRVNIHLINFLFFPLLATSFIDETCFYYAYNEQESIIQSYVTKICISVDISGCASFIDIPNTYSFKPPFQYTWTCFSSLMKIYGPVYSFSFLGMMFQSIIYRVTKKVIYNIFYICYGCKHSDSIPIKWTPLSVQLDYDYKMNGCKNSFQLDNNNYLNNGNFQLFEAKQFTINVITFVAFFFTIGAVVPLIGFVIMLCFAIYLHITVSELGALLMDAKKESDEKYEHAKSIIEKDCEGLIESINVASYSLIPTIIIYYTFLIFDMVGYKGGFGSAELVLISGFIALMIYMIYIRSYKLINKKIDFYINKKNIINNEIELIKQVNPIRFTYTERITMSERNTILLEMPLEIDEDLNA